MRTVWASVASSNGYADDVVYDVAAADADTHTVTDADACASADDKQLLSFEQEQE